MSNKFEQPLTVSLKAQTYVIGFVWLSHLAALAVLLLPLTLPVVLRWSIALLVLASLAFNLCRYRNRGNPISQIHWDRARGWRVSFKNGTEYKAELLPDSYVSPLLVIVRLQCEDKKTREIVMTCFGQVPDTMRRLRVRMRYDPTTAAAMPDSDAV